MNSIIPPKLFAWLSDSGSFMQRLKRHGVENAQIRILKEGWSFGGSLERTILSLPFLTFTWVREVVIYSDDTTWMFARTVIPRKTLTGKERELRYLKTRSLGSLLFSYSDLVRSEFSYFQVDPDKEWNIKCMKDGVWGRRSLFTFSGKSLLLTEVFSPELGDVSL